MSTGDLTAGRLGGAAPASAGARTWRGRDVALMTALSLAAFLVAMVGLVAALAMAGVPVDDPDALVAAPAFTLGTLALTGIALIGAVWAGLRWRRLSWESIGVAAPQRRWILIAALAALGLRIAAVPLGLLLQAAGFPMDNPQLPMLLPEGGSWAVLAATLVLAGVLIPIAEELFFRGVLYAWLRERWGVAVGVVVSSAVFGAVHGHPTLAVIAGSLGVATALIYERSRSLPAAIAAHMTFNILGIGLLYALVALGVELPGM